MDVVLILLHAVLFCVLLVYHIIKSELNNSFYYIQALFRMGVFASMFLGDIHPLAQGLMFRKSFIFPQESVSKTKYQ